MALQAGALQCTGLDQICQNKSLNPTNQELLETIYFGIQKWLKARSEEGEEGGFDICKGRIG